MTNRTTAIKTTATPTKLRSGEWGAKVPGRPQPGDEIIIVARSGKRWDAVVERVLWSGDGVSIVATRNAGDRRAATRGRRPATTGRRCTCCGRAIRSESQRCTAEDGLCAVVTDL